MSYRPVWCDYRAGLVENAVNSLRQAQHTFYERRAQRHYRRHPQNAIRAGIILGDINILCTTASTARSTYTYTQAAIDEDVPFHKTVVFPRRANGLQIAAERVHAVSYPGSLSVVDPSFGNDLETLEDLG